MDEVLERRECPGWTFGDRQSTEQAVMLGAGTDFAPGTLQFPGLSEARVGGGRGPSWAGSVPPGQPHHCAVKSLAFRNPNCLALQNPNGSRTWQLKRATEKKASRCPSRTFSFKKSRSLPGSASLSTTCKFRGIFSLDGTVTSDPSHHTRFLFLGDGPAFPRDLPLRAVGLSSEKPLCASV